MTSLNQVTITVDEYNRLRDNLTAAEGKVSALEASIEELAKKNNQRVILKETTVTQSFLGIGEDVTVEYDIINLDKAKKEIETLVGAEIETLAEENEKYKRSLAKEAELRLDAEMEVSRLKHRNWWQRLLNR